ncbi:MAG: hypothetical protein ABID63_08570 [Pseudomonadota bacterium]
MKLYTALILLGCGTICGGVIAPILTTDILGFNRILDFTFHNISFDWGSFIGGAIAGTAAFSTFMLQRNIDLRARTEQQLGHVRIFCVRSLAIIREITLSRVPLQDDTNAKKTRFIGFVGVSENLCQFADSLEEDSKTEIQDFMREELRKSASMIIPSIERLGQQFDNLSLSNEIHPKIFELLEKIAKDQERIRRRSRGIILDCDGETWTNRGLREKIYILYGLTRIIEDLENMDKKIELLSEYCKR